MKKGQASLQIGKNGLTSGIITVLKNSFKTREDIKIHVLKTGGHSREKIKEIAEKIASELGKNYTYRIIGFSIFIKKWRRVRQE